MYGFMPEAVPLSLSSQISKPDHHMVTIAERCFIAISKRYHTLGRNADLEYGIWPNVYTRCS